MTEVFLYSHFFLFQNVQHLMSTRPNPKKTLRRTDSRRQAVDVARELSRAVSRPARPRLMRAGRTVPQAANYFDTAFATYNCDTTGSIALLNPVPQGVTTTSRTGKKIQMKSLQCRGILQNGTTTGISQAAFMIVYDRRPAGALPAITDILNSVSPNSFLNDTNSSRFKILKRVDETMIGNASTLTTDSVALEIDFFMKFPKKYSVVSYKALGTGAIADIDEGAIYILTMGGNVAGTAASALNCGFRLRYYDTSG